MVYISSFY